MDLSFYQWRMLRFYDMSRYGDTEYQGCIDHNFALREYGTEAQRHIPLTWFRDRGQRVIKRLEELGLLKRVRIGTRRSLVLITPKGRRYIKRVYAGIESEGRASC